MIIAEFIFLRIDAIPKPLQSTPNIVAGSRSLGESLCLGISPFSSVFSLLTLSLVPSLFLFRLLLLLLLLLHADDHAIMICDFACAALFKFKTWKNQQSKRVRILCELGFSVLYSTNNRSNLSMQRSGTDNTIIMIRDSIRNNE